MPVELRKRKAPAAPPPPPVKRKATAKTGKAARVKEAAAKVAEKEDKPEKAEELKEEAKEETKEEKKEEEEPKAEEPKAKEAKKTGGKLEVGDVVDLDGFGGEIETNDGEKTTLKKLVDESKSGVVLFTYPKASTPGCRFSLPFCPNISLTPSQAQSKSASSATHMSPSPRTVWLFTVSAPTLPRPTQPSRRSRSSLTRCCVTPSRLSLAPLVSRRHPREQLAVSLLLARRARFSLLRREAHRVLLTVFRLLSTNCLANPNFKVLVPST